MSKLLLFLTLCISTSAIGQKEEFVALLTQHAHRIAITAGEFTKDGGALLKQAVGDAQFVLIGEQHGLADVQEFSEALFALTHNHGFNNVAVETAPLAAEHVARLAAGDEQAAADFFKATPMAIPFFYSVEGMQMARAIHEISGGSAEFWGLDQVFMVEPRLSFARLEEMAQNDQAGKLAKKYREQAHTQFAEAMQSGNPGGAIMMTMTDEDFTTLRRAFSNDPAAIDMIDQIALSKKIYGHWFAGEMYLNNSVRSRLMKDLFNKYYNEAMQKGGGLPRVMFKFGSNHCIRGLTSTHIYDLGNMVSELAAINGTESLHIKLTAAKGMALNPLEGPQAFDASADWHDWLQEGLLEPLETANGDWVLLDLRPIRHLRLKQADEAIKSLVFGFDFWIIIPEGHPVTPFR